MEPISILYLEDSPIDMDLSLSLLGAAGILHRAHAVKTEKSFGAALQEKSYDLILADYSLPGFDGHLALEMAKEYCPEIPFIFVSGTMGEELAIELLQSGATDYVLKQRLKRLVPAVQRALRQARDRKARKKAEADVANLLLQEQKARAEAEDRARELAQVNQQLEEFAFAASHDLQEPLRTVKVSAQLLSRRYSSLLDQQGLDFIHHIEHGTNRMANLIGDLLAYSQISHNPEGRLLPIALEPLIQQTLADLRHQIEENRAMIKIGPLPTVLADEKRIAQVFQNLISNSLKYRSHQSPVIQISAIPERDGQWTISVKDNGIGFDQQYADKIFGLFKRLYRDEYPGTGVGLALVKKIVEQHGGQIRATGKLGEGALFSFTLNAASSKQTAATTKPN